MLSDFGFTIDEAWVMWSGVDCEPMSAAHWYGHIHEPADRQSELRIELPYMSFADFIATMGRLMARGYVRAGVVVGNEIHEVPTLPVSLPDPDELFFILSSDVVDEVDDFFTRRDIAILGGLADFPIVLPTRLPAGTRPFPGREYDTDTRRFRLSYYSDESHSHGQGLRLLVEESRLDLRERDTGGFVLPPPPQELPAHFESLLGVEVSRIEYRIASTWAVISYEWELHGVHFRSSDIWSRPDIVGELALTEPMRFEARDIALSLIEQNDPND